MAAPLTNHLLLTSFKKVSPTFHSIPRRPRSCSLVRGPLCWLWAWNLFESLWLWFVCTGVLTDSMFGNGRQLGRPATREPCRVYRLPLYEDGFKNIVKSIRWYFLGKISLSYAHVVHSINLTASSRARLHLLLNHGSTLCCTPDYFLLESLNDLRCSNICCLCILLPLNMPKQARVCFPLVTERMKQEGNNPIDLRPQGQFKWLRWNLNLYLNHQPFSHFFIVPEAMTASKWPWRL